MGLYMRVFVYAHAQVSTLGLWGRSMGAVTALLYGQRNPCIAGMVSRCCILYGVWFIVALWLYGQRNPCIAGMVSWCCILYGVWCVVHSGIVAVWPAEPVHCRYGELVLHSVWCVVYSGIEAL